MINKKYWNKKWWYYSEKIPYFGIYYSVAQWAAIIIKAQKSAVWSALYTIMTV